MGDLARALDGYSTAGSPGTGLGAVVRTATDFDVFTQPGVGTALVARILRQRRAVRPRPRSGWSIGRCRAKRSVAMLACAFVRGGWLCAVADGLGHGPIAAEAAATIIETVRTGLRHAPSNC